LISVALWGIAELLEPNWVVSFLQMLNSYVPIQSVVDILFWNPYQIISIGLLGGMLWLIYQQQAVAPESLAFSGLLAFAICINALIIPMFGMLHIVLMGPVLVMILSGYQNHYPVYARQMWVVVLGMLGAGWLAFILPLLLTDSTSLQITAAEWVYRFTMPVVLGLASLPLIFYPVTSLSDFRKGE
jgi:hypothetical protein